MVNGSTKFATNSDRKVQGEGKPRGGNSPQLFSGYPIPPGKVNHRPEASLASSSARAARSVDSQYLSRVIELRNTLMLESSRFCHRGQHQSAVMVRRARSDWSPRAGHKYIGTTWKPVRPGLVLGDTTGTDDTGQQHPGWSAAACPRAGAKEASQLEGTWRNATSRA
jgi:hypothetical protein